MEEFFARLKEHKLVQWTLGYVAVSFALIPVLDIIASRFGWSQTAVRCIIIALGTGFFVMLVVAWYHGEREEQRVTRAERTILAALVVIGTLTMWQIGPVAVKPSFAKPVVAGVASAPSAPPNSIAVLPFTNESSDKQQDYFADGIAEDLLNLLTEVQPLQVAARTSSFSFKGKGLAIPEIAAKLHVANVLEGSVFKQGDEVRVSAQLVRVADGYQIWSQSYDRKLDDIFAIQDGIAADVVKNLKIKLLGALPTVRQTDPKAYALYLQARQLANQATAGALKSSDALYRQVLAIDPRYVQAWVGLSSNFLTEASLGVLSNEQGLRQAREATEKALAVDPDYAPAQARLGWLAMLQNDLPAAARYLERALVLDPTDLDVLANSATLLENLGRLPPAIAVDEYVLARDPVNPSSLKNLGIDYLNAGRYDEAIAKFHTLLSLSPDHGNAHFLLGEALLLKGDAAGGLAQMQQEKSEVWRSIGLPLAYCALGRKVDADAALIAKDAKNWSYNIAYDYAYCGEADQAFTWLDKAVAYRDPGLSEILSNPLFDKIRQDPRWLPLLRKLGYAPEKLAKIQFTVTLPGATDASGASRSAASPEDVTSTTLPTSTPANTASNSQP